MDTSHDKRVQCPATRTEGEDDEGGQQVWEGVFADEFADALERLLPMGGQIGGDHGNGKRHGGKTGKQTEHQ